MSSNDRQNLPARYVRLNDEKEFIVEDQQQNHEVFTLTKFDTNNTNLSLSHQQELKTLANLKHSQIQKIQIDQQGSYWLILQSYIEGQSYKELLEEKGKQNQPLFSEYEVVQLLNQILPVLSYLHSHNVTHRNISPSSLILREQDQMPVLVNFGVMQNIDKTNQDESQNTKRVDLIKKDLRDLAITALTLLTGEKCENWDKALEKLSDQRREVFQQMLNMNSISANSVLLNINSIFQDNFGSEPLPGLLKYLMVGVGSLFFLALIIPNLLSPLPPPPLTSTSTPSTPPPFTPPTSTSTPPTFTPTPPPFTPPTSTSTPPPFTPPTFTPTPTSPQLSSQEAVDLIQAWLEAKKEAYGIDHNDQVIYKYTTGRYLSKNIGSWSELKTEEKHYTYEKPTVQSLGQLDVQGNQATLDVKIDEYRTLYDQEGKIIDSNTGHASGSYTATFQQDNNIWKIENLQKNNRYF